MRGMAAFAFGLALMLCGCALQVSPSTSDPASGETPLPDGVSRVTATSAIAAPGTMQRFSLNTHCGLENAVIDFAGSLWDPVGYPGRVPNPPRGVSDPVDQGTITLTISGTAVFVSSSGTRIDLLPHAGQKDVSACY